IVVDSSEGEEPKSNVDVSKEEFPTTMVDSSVTSKEIGPADTTSAEPDLSTNIAQETTAFDEEEPVDWMPTDEEDNALANERSERIAQEKANSPTPEFEDVTLPQSDGIDQETKHDEVADQTNSPPVMFNEDFVDDQED